MAKRKSRRTGASKAQQSNRPNADYESFKEERRRISAEKSLAGRDIGPLPPVANKRRRNRAGKSFEYFCRAYLDHVFTLKWSTDHTRVIVRIEQAVRKGGLFAFAMPRGSGKTSLVEAASIWSTFHGYRRFVVPLGASAAHAQSILSSIKSEIESNELLLEDYPEVCYPIQALEGIINRAAGQLHRGERTRITWSANQIVLPTIPGSQAAGAIIKTAGITGSFRGLKFKRPDGATVRPDFVFPDDPQTDESAKSITQSAERAKIIAGAVLGLAGPGQKISGLMPCTVIRPNDMADRILDRDQHPEWNGERTKMVYSFPSNEKLWDEYRTIRHEGMRAGDDGAAATKFYRRHRKAMDRGAKVAWPERHNPDELSALQHAMNLKLLDEAAFMAEYQNEPLPERPPEEGELTVELVSGQTNGLKRGQVPTAAAHLTCFVDVQKACLFYVVVAWRPDFSGAVIDYGTFPDQQRTYFALREVQQTLERHYPGKGMEGAIYAGLGDLTDALLTRPWSRQDGARMQIERLLIDANWGLTTHVVKEFCRQTHLAGLIYPSHGRYVGASGKPVVEWKKEPGETRGLNWRIRRGQNARDVRHVVWDTNFWKSSTARGFHTAIADRGALSLWGQRGTEHLLFAEQCTAEFPVTTEGRGRSVQEWQLRPGRDNHWWDCLVGCAVAASIEGCTPTGIEPPARRQSTPRKKRMSLAERRAAKRRGQRSR